MHLDQSLEVDTDEETSLLATPANGEHKVGRVKITCLALFFLLACSRAFSSSGGKTASLGGLETKDSGSISGIPDSVIMQGLKSQWHLNAIYSKRDGGLYTVNGEVTYWSDEGFFMYWCPFTGFQRWQIASEAELPNARDSKICNWNAFAPSGEFVLGSGWSEWDASSKSAVERPDSEVIAYEPTNSGSVATIPDSVMLQGLKSQSHLNAIYSKRDGDLYTVNGKVTYWSDAGFFVYWCPFTGFQRWQIAPEAELTNARDSQICNWNAFAPTGASVLGSGWSEWDASSKSAVERPHSEVTRYEPTDSEASTSKRPDSEATTSKMKQETSAQTALQTKTSKSSSCPPPHPAFELHPQACPGRGRASCLNMNKAYDNFSAAWSACGSVEGCDVVMKWPKNKYYLRRSTDPAYQGRRRSLRTALLGMPYHCP